MRLLLQLQPIHIWCFSWDLPGFVWNLKLGRFELAGQKAGGTSCCPNLLLFLVVRISILYSFVSRCFFWIIWNVQLSWCFWSPFVKTRLTFLLIHHWSRFAMFDMLFHLFFGLPKEPGGRCSWGAIVCLLQLEAHDRMRSASNAERHATPWPPNGRPVSEADPGGPRADGEVCEAWDFCR